MTLLYVQRNKYLMLDAGQVAKQDHARSRTGRRSRVEVPQYHPLLRAVLIVRMDLNADRGLVPMAR